MNQEVIMEDRVREYFHGLSESRDEISLSLAKLAEQIGCSVATVHRTVRKLENEDIISIRRSKAKNRPVAKSDTINELLRQITDKLLSKQNEVNALKEALQYYESREVIKEVELDNGVLAVFYKT